MNTNSNFKGGTNNGVRSIRIDPDYAKAHNNLGNAYGKSGKYKEAIKSFKQAIRLDPD
jgi:tetratricopeptide (TPR) repeat protein